MSIYCPPCPAREEWPDKMTDSVYVLLKKMGIKNIYGYYEDETSEECLKAALAMCEKHEMTFYPRLKIFDEYLGVAGNAKNPLYYQKTETEREALDKRFVERMEMLKEYASFGGIFFSDERPYEVYDGMGAASRLFANCCPNKEFHYNALNYFPDDRTMFYMNGDDSDRDYQLVGDLAFDSKNRFERFKVYLDGYLDKCTTNHLSCDLYPFAPVWKEVPTSIHRGLYETNSIFATYRQERGVETYIYIQVGDWDISFRKIERAETALHMNITAAYQIDGFVFFPGVFPNDWIEDPQFTDSKNGGTGLIDVYGKPTEHYSYIARLIEHLQACAPTLLNAKWHGVCTVGEFDGGFGDVNFDQVDWSECIYKGGMTELEAHEYKGMLPDVKAKSQLFIGVFENEAEYIYWITNNSIVTDTSFEIANLGDWRLTVDGKVLEGNGTVKVSSLNAGEAAMLEVKK